MRVVWLLAGLVCVGVGGVGVVVPGLPTTVFFVAAAWCFSRSSQRMERWVLGLPGVGQLVSDYRSGLGMPRRAKVVAITCIVVAVSISAVIALEHPAARAGVTAAGLFGIWWILQRVPTRETELRVRMEGRVE
ncbi:MAG: YbaN family protein [Acidimicrobiia bacterium]|nr:YbaN family protein [Acidimicrobiia bacterium]MDH5288964.1 YbaN family protein [Acidimicrobiia bacterium]